MIGFILRGMKNNNILSIEKIKKKSIIYLYIFLFNISFLICFTLFLLYKIRIKEFFHWIKIYFVIIKFII